MAYALAVVLGVLTWSFLEYVLHRFLGHDKRFMPNFFSVEHTRHHSVGNYFAPAVKKALAAAAAMALVLPLAVLAAGWGLGLAYSISFVTMYVLYEALHRFEHVHPGIGAYGRYLRRHHFHHHFGNPKMNHGVTSPIWDVVFGTYEAPDRIRVPSKLQMQWLVNPATGRVYDAHANVYEVV
jgi:4-hydroxysphinganine ceramide fatty acyl 2-hydroxylase